MAWRSTQVRRFGVALVLVSVIKFLLIDTFAVQPGANSFTPALNSYFLGFVGLLLVVLFAANQYWRDRGTSPTAKRFQELERVEQYGFAIMVVIANLITLWVFSVEAVRYFDSREVQAGGDYFSAMQRSRSFLTLP